MILNIKSSEGKWDYRTNIISLVSPTTKVPKPQSHWHTATTTSCLSYKPHRQVTAQATSFTGKHQTLE